MNTSIVRIARKVFITLLTLDLRSVNYDVYVYLMPQTDLHNLNFGWQLIAVINVSHSVSPSRSSRASSRSPFG